MANFPACLHLGIRANMVSYRGDFVQRLAQIYVIDVLAQNILISGLLAVLGGAQ